MRRVRCGAPVMARCIPVWFALVLVSCSAANGSDPGHAEEGTGGSSGVGGGLADNEAGAGASNRGSGGESGIRAGGGGESGTRAGSGGEPSDAGYGTGTDANSGSSGAGGASAQEGGGGAKDGGDSGGGGAGGNTSGGADGGGLAGNKADAGSVYYDVFLLAGQSNMDGRALAADLTAAQRKPQDNVTIYYRFLPFASDKTAYSTNGFTALVPGFSVPPSYSGSLPSTTFGPEIGFATAMRQAQPSMRLALIKGSHGGTSLVEHWKPGTKGQSSTQGVCYREFLSTLGTAKAALQKEGHSFAIRGLLWHQGESDVDAGVTQSAYTDMLKTFIDRIREDVGDPQLPIAVGEVYEDGTRGAIRAAQRQVATSTPNVGFVSADGLTTLDAGTHFNASSQLILGKRFADGISTLLSAR